MQIERIRRIQWNVALYLSASAAVIAYSLYSIGNHDIAWPFLALALAALLLFAAVPISPLYGLTGYLLLAHGLPRYSAAHDLLLANHVLEWLCALLALGTLLWARRRQIRPDLARPPIIFMLLFMAWIGVSLVDMLLQGSWQPHLRHHPLLFFQALVLFLISSHYLLNERRSYTLAFVICLIPAVRWLLQPSADFYLEGDTAMLSAITLALALMGAAHAPGRILRAGFAATAINAAAMLLITQNRAAAIATAAALFVLWLSARRRTLVLGIALLVGAVVITIANPHDYWNRFRAIWSPEITHATAALDRSTVQERLELWRASYDMARDNPWLGVGPGNYPNAVVFYNPSLAKLATHNTVAAIAAETGIPGLLLFLGLIVSIITILVRQMANAGSFRQQAARMMLAAIVGFLAGGLFISRHDSPLLYLMLGWAVAITRPTPIENRTSVDPDMDRE